VELFDLEIPIRSTGAASVKADFKALEASAQGTAGKVSAAMDRTATATAGVTGNVTQAAAAIRRLGVPADQAAATLRKMGFSAAEVERELKDVVPAANAVERELREITPAADQAAVALGRTSSGVVNVTKTAGNVTPVLTRMRNVMSAGVATAIGMSGAMGSLGGAMLAFAGGTGAALAVISAIGAMVVAIRLLTKGMREAEAQQDALTDGLVEQAKDALPDATRATQALTAATNELAEADKRVAANTGVFNFLNDIAKRGDPVAKLLATIVNQIGRLPRGRQRDAATAVNQGQINSQQALVDLYAREAELVAETIQIRGKNTESVQRATSWQAFLNAEAQKSIYTIPQQNALLSASAAITDALTDKTETRTTSTRSLADVERERTAVLLELLKLEAPTPERWAEIRTRADVLTAALASGNVPLAERVNLLKELAAIEAGTGFGTVEPSLDFQPQQPPRPTLRGIEPPTQEGESAAAPDSLFEGDDISARLHRAIVESGKTAEEAATIAAEQFHAAGASLASSFEQGLVGAFESIGRGGSFGQMIAGFAGQMLQALGNMAIKFGVAVSGIGALMESAMKALASLNPFVAIAAGVALVALGSALGGAASKSFGGSAPGGSGGELRPITTTYRVPASNLAQARESAMTGTMPKAVTPISVNYFGKGRDPGFSRWLTEQVGQSQARGVRG
jgi:hypothetical protein